MSSKSHVCDALLRRSLVSFFNVSPPSLWYSSSVSLSFLHQGPANTARWRLALWVGSSCMQGTLLAACCWLSHPFKSLFKLFSSLTAVFYYTCIFSPQFLWQWENLGVGYIYSGLVLILTHPWQVVIPPWPAWTVRDYHQIIFIHVCSEVFTLMPFMHRGYTFMCEHAVYY